MTQNQIAAASLAENRRHNLESEKDVDYQNKVTSKHYQRQDAINREHYERSDTAGMISANASALNAQSNAQNAATNRKNYEMAYDIEYGWTNNQDPYVIKDMPLSARQKILGLQQTQQTMDLEKAYKTAQTNLVNKQANLAGKQAAQSATQAIANIGNMMFGKAGAIAGIESIVDWIQ